jgi:hypothetical protein
MFFCVFSAKVLAFGVNGVETISQSDKRFALFRVRKNLANHLLCFFNVLSPLGSFSLKQIPKQRNLRIVHLGKRTRSFSFSVG